MPRFNRVACLNRGRLCGATAICSPLQQPQLWRQQQAVIEMRNLGAAIYGNRTAATMLPKHIISTSSPFTPGGIQGQVGS